jgi:hypothetical protein
MKAATAPKITLPATLGRTYRVVDGLLTGNDEPIVADYSINDAPPSSSNRSNRGIKLNPFGSLITFFKSTYYYFNVVFSNINLEKSWPKNRFKGQFL